jgi:hypothetical protein
MGHRGENVSPGQEDWGRQQPWQQSSDLSSGAWDNGSSGAWDNGPQGYANGYGPEAGYQGQAPQGYAGGAYGAGGHQQQPAPGYGQSGGYPAAGAGNDWYGGQPGGAGFADTGTQAFNGQVIDEYGTGARPTGGYPAQGGPAAGARPGTGRLALPSAQSVSQTRQQQAVAATSQQQRLDSRSPRQGRSPSGAYPASASGAYQQLGSGAHRQLGSGAYPAAGGRSTGATRVPSGPADAFEGVNRPPRAAIGSGRKRGSRGGRAKALLLATVAVVVVGLMGAAAYVFVLKPKPATNSQRITAGVMAAPTPQPSMQACIKTLGQFCHIETRALDPAPLTVSEIYPPAFTNTQDKLSYSLVADKIDTTCANAVVGTNLIAALKTDKCTQVVRGSYISGGNKIMGTIGVVNLFDTTSAHHVGKVIGQNDFVAPLVSKTGDASKLGNGTGIVEADYKGHYLILIWAEYVDGTVPKTKAQDAPLDQFASDLIAETANTALTQRMVNGSPSASGV